MTVSSRGLPYFTAAIVGLIVMPELPDGWSLPVGSMVVGVTTIALAAFLVDRGTTFRRVHLEPGTVLALFLYLWHFSFFLILLGGIASTYRVEAYLELVPTENNRALALCAVGILCFLGGVQTVGMPRENLLSGFRRPSKRWRGTMLTYFGAALCVGYFLVAGRSLVGRYELVFLEADPLRRAYNLGVLVILVGLALRLSVDRLRFSGALLLLLPVVAVVGVSAALGSRWVAMSVFLTILVAIAIRGTRTQTWVLLVVTVAFGAGALMLKDVRAGDEVRSIAFSERTTNPLIEAFEEVGQAFRTTVGTMAQYGPQGRSYEYGATLLPAVLSVVPSLPPLVMEVRRPNEELAQVFFAQLYRDEGYTLGFSLIAELYMNFGRVGVFLGMISLGLLVGFAFRRSHEKGNTLWAAGLVFTVVVLAFGVRNDVFTWFRNWSWGIAILVLTHSLSLGWRRAGSEP